MQSLRERWHWEGLVPLELYVQLASEWWWLGLGRWRVQIVFRAAFSTL